MKSRVRGGEVWVVVVVVVELERGRGGRGDLFSLSALVISPWLAETGIASRLP